MVRLASSGATQGRNASVCNRNVQIGVAWGGGFITHLSVVTANELV
jgi:hypothetical protein